MYNYMFGGVGNVLEGCRRNEMIVILGRGLEAGVGVGESFGFYGKFFFVGLVFILCVFDFLKSK